MIKYTNRYTQHERAEGIAVSYMFASGYHNVTRKTYRDRSGRHRYGRHIINADHAGLGPISVIVYGIFTRAFSSRETALYRLVNGYIKLQPQDIDDNVEIWIVDRLERIYKFNKMEMEEMCNCDMEQIRTAAG